MTDCVKKYAGIDFDAVKTDEEAKALAKSIISNMKKDTTRVISLIFSLRNIVKKNLSSLHS